MPQFVNTLARYIAHMQSEAADSNACDYRATYQAELDDIARRYTDAFARGESVITQIPPEDLARCRKLFDSRRQSGRLYADDLVHDKLMGQWILAPVHVFLIDEVRKLKEVLA